MNSYEKTVFDMYIQCGMGKSKQCEECKKERPNLLRPLSLYGAGTKYEQSKYRVLFVGKIAIGGDSELSYNDMITDATTFAKDLYDANYSSFWSYLRTIASTLYDEEDSWDQIALTNFIKCNDGSQVDNSTWTMRCNCADFLQKEIELLMPEHIVFFMASDYDENIKMVFDQIKDTQYKEIGNTIRLWNFTGVLGKREIKVLRCGHPQGKPKEEFVRQVVDFISR